MMRQQAGGKDKGEHSFLLAAFGDDDENRMRQSFTSNKRYINLVYTITSYALFD
jgi:hypothetical protein